MNTLIKKSSHLLTVAALVIAQASCAAPEDERGERRGPPAEAFEACANLNVGDACSVSGRNGETLEGECVTPREEGDEALVCAPAGGPPGGRGDR